MNSILALIIYVFSSFNCAQANNDIVYICTGKYAVAYHKTPRCKGLNNCQGDIESVKLFYAQSKGRRPCRYCCR